MNLNEMRQERGSLVAQMRSLIDGAEAAKRDLNDTEQETYDRLDAAQVEMKGKISREESLASLESDLGAPSHSAQKPAVGKSQSPLASAEYHSAFEEMLRLGKNGITSDIVGALQVGTDSEGGYVVPEEYETKLVAALLDNNVMRSLCTVINTAADRNIPVESTIGAATWTAEEAAYTESDPAFGQVVLGAYKLGRIIKVSEELLQDSFFSIDSYIADNFGRSFGTAEEAAFVAGAGSTKPTGVVNGSGLGKTAAGAAAITSDELIDLFHSLKRPYRKNGTFLMADGTAKLIRKLKDSDGQYVWQAGLQAGQPDMLLGRPAEISDSVPAATTGLKSIVFGDFSYYWIADRAGVSLQRLNELYAANGQVGFRMSKRTEGKVVLAEAFKHLIQA